MEAYSAFHSREVRARTRWLQIVQPDGLRIFATKAAAIAALGNVGAP